MVQVLPIAPVQMFNETRGRMTGKPSETPLEGDIGQNIKRLALEMSSSTLKHIREIIDNITLGDWHRALDEVKHFHGMFTKQDIQRVLEEKYGPVIASNFGLATNTMMSFLKLLIDRADSIIIERNIPDPDLIASALNSPVIESYARDSEMLYPSEVPRDIDPRVRKIVQSLIFTSNMASLIVLVALTASTVEIAYSVTRRQIEQLERLLRDWALDILIQVREELNLELEVRGPFDISLPALTEDQTLAEMGLDDYVDDLG
ncbi:MAG: hypothetical protein QXS20_07800 [Candidatus Thorarchaeota archaeon]